MSNFNFIKAEWPEVFKEAQEAEKNTLQRPRYAGLLCRSALEVSLNWIYANDPDLEFPYDTNLSSLIHHEDFKNSIKPSLFNELNLIRRLGNNAAHGKNIAENQALASLMYLFKFTAYLSKYYSEADPIIPDFNESIIPTGKEKDKTIVELQKKVKELQKNTDKQRREKIILEEKAKENELFKIRLKEQNEKLKIRKEERKQQVGMGEITPELISEAKTRKNYIDVVLQEAGWSPNAPNVPEFEVKGMPLATNPSGIGYVDYVLWGNDGLPLAVVEAKKTLLSAEKGKRQAEEYADCLEQMTGQRPIIFYTNGFEYHIWDDMFYPPRQVSGFYTKSELQTLVNRRVDRLDIRDYKINKNIAGRPYQYEAIKRIVNRFVTTNSKGLLKGKSQKALLVMATGSGKTRTAAAIVDVLTKCNWAKRVLFLADRNSLVTQAKNAFNEHLSHLSSIDLTKEKEDDGTRIVFSTYPTIMNRIDGVKSGDQRFYGIGHFDLVIIDEAHRSVYAKYKAIFDYFDSLLIGLTATPKTEVDHNTYSLFEIEDNIPTYTYELETAVNDGFLVPPKSSSVPIKFPRKGVKYKDLSEHEKIEWEKKFGDPEKGGPDTIDSNALNKWLFNTDTVDKVLQYLMEKGIKVGGESVGKSIIFAKSHQHAKFIEERFNKKYPEYSGKFLRVIDNYEPRAQNLLELFCLKNEDKDPMIAVSVDMMDTGVDAPRVVNLVFFKAVYSVTKFWQMIGRGTRLSPGLFGPNKNKEHFYIFDFCENLEFFEENPDGEEPINPEPLSKKIFRLKLEVSQLLKNNNEVEGEELLVSENYLNQLHHNIATLDKSRFVVRRSLRYVVEYEVRVRWNNLSMLDESEILEHLSNLSDVTKGGDEIAKRFDVLMLSLIQFYLLKDSRLENAISRLIRIGNGLLKKVNIPAIAKQEKLIRGFTDEEFWKSVSINKLEIIRVDIRNLVKFLDKEETKVVYTHFEDEINENKVTDFDLVSTYRNLKSYRDRVESFIRKNEHHLTIDKLKKNLPITAGDLEQLEKFLFDGDERGTKEEFKEEVEGQSLGVFIRSIVGLDMEAVQKAFSEFLHSGNYTAQQVRFIDIIVNHLIENGTLNKQLLFEPPFTEIHQDGMFGVFDDGQVRKVISIVDEINERAEVG